jgi:hypothetical protein
LDDQCRRPDATVNALLDSFALHVLGQETSYKGITSSISIHYFFLIQLQNFVFTHGIAFG